MEATENLPIYEEIKIANLMQPIACFENILNPGYRIQYRHKT